MLSQIIACQSGGVEQGLAAAGFGIAGRSEGGLLGLGDLFTIIRPEGTG